MKAQFELSTKQRKNNVTIAVKAGRDGHSPKYVGTMTFDDPAVAEAFLGTLERAKSSFVEVSVAR